MKEFLEKLENGLEEYDDFNKVYDSLNVIFKYELKDAWGIPIKSLYLTNDGFIYLLGDENKVLNINMDNVLSILDKYYKEIKNIEDLSMPLSNVLDGYNNSFAFKVNNEWINIDESNIEFLSLEQIESSKYATIVLNLYNELYSELISQNFEIKDYFQLSDEIEEEEE